jgi:hypothetical protein
MMNNKSKKSYQGKKKSSNGLTIGGMGSVNTTINSPSMPVFPPRIVKKLRYSTTFSGATTSGAITSTQVFRANDLFDPDFTGTGHQPMGFDQLMTWYNHFCVTSCRIKLVFKNTASSSPTVAFRVDGDSTALTVIDRIVEAGGAVTECLELKGAYGANKVISAGLDICKLQGVSKGAITADSTLRGNAAASPTEISYIHITMWDTAGTTGSMECDVVLEQTATFTEPRDITESMTLGKSQPEFKCPVHDQRYLCTCRWAAEKEAFKRLLDTPAVPAKSRVPQQVEDSPGNAADSKEPPAKSWSFLG